MSKLIHSIVSVTEGHHWGDGKAYECACGTEFSDSGRIKTHIRMFNNPVEIDHESQEWKDNSARILSTYKLLASTKLDDIFAKYEELGFVVIGSELRSDHSVHSTDSKIVFVDSEFIRPSRNDDELAYILLTMFFYIITGEYGTVDRDPYMVNYGETYARLVFSYTDNGTPERFINK